MEAQPLNAFVLAPSSSVLPGRTKKPAVNLRQWPGKNSVAEISTDIIKLCIFVNDSLDRRHNSAPVACRSDYDGELMSPNSVSPGKT